MIELEIEKWQKVSERFADIEEFTEFFFKENEDRNINILTVHDIKELIYKYLGIDPVKLEQERRELLKQVQDNAKKENLP